jgi:hypothetical protein
MIALRRHPLQCLYALLVCLITALILAGCGSDSAPDPEQVTPTIVAAKMVDSGVQVTYRAPGADGGSWPVLSISVREIHGSLPAWSEDVQPVEEEGTVAVPMEIEPNRDVTVFGSIFYEDGKRVHLTETHIRS